MALKDTDLFIVSDGDSSNNDGAGENYSISYADLKSSITAGGGGGGMNSVYTYEGASDPGTNNEHTHGLDIADEQFIPWISYETEANAGGRTEYTWPGGWGKVEGNHSTNVTTSPPNKRELPTSVDSNTISYPDGSTRSSWKIKILY